jgi:hypothetical protein
VPKSRAGVVKSATLRIGGPVAVAAWLDGAWHALSVASGHACRTYDDWVSMSPVATRTAKGNLVQSRPGWGEWLFRPRGGIRG